MKKIFALAATALFIMTSCSGDDAAPTNPGTNPTSGLLKKAIETFDDGSTLTTNYTYNGNKLVSIADSEGETLYTYTGDLMTEIKYYEGETLTQRNVLAYDNNNKLITHIMYLSQNFATKSEYTYNNDGTITIERYIGNHNSQTTPSNSHVVTIQNNNIIEVDMGGAIETYTYTNTIDPLSLITGYSGWTLAFADGGVNNISSYLYAGSTGDIIENHTYTYTYNANNLPATSVDTDAETGEQITTQYFY